MRLRRDHAALMVAALGLAGCGSQVEQAVKRELVDGASARFRDVQRCPGDAAVFRGEVNAKNRMGAYVGFEPFFYDGIGVAFLRSPDFTKVMDRCYGTGPKASPATPAAPTVASSLGSWSAHEDVNPVDDSKTFTAMLFADEGTSARDEPITLVIRCQSHKTELYVNWNDYLGDDSHDVYNDWKRVTVRVGTTEATTQRWGISTDNEATFAPGSAVELIRRMAKADRLVLQTTPYGENPVTAVFSLKGIDVATKALAEGCGWKL